MVLCYLLLTCIVFVFFCIFSRFFFSSRHPYFDDLNAITKQQKAAAAQLAVAQQLHGSGVPSTTAPAGVLQAHQTNVQNISQQNMAMPIKK